MQTHKPAADGSEARAARKIGSYRGPLTDGCDGPGSESVSAYTALSMALSTRVPRATRVD